MIEVVSLLPAHWRPAIEATLQLNSICEADQEGINEQLLFALLNAHEPPTHPFTNLAKCLLHRLGLDDHVELLAIAIIEAAAGQYMRLKRYLSHWYFGLSKSTNMPSQDIFTVTT